MEIIIKFHQTYFNNGYFNIPAQFNNHFGEHGNEIKITTPGTTFNRKINKKSTYNKHPRIMGGKYFRDWLKNKNLLNHEVKLIIISKNHISIELP